MKISVRLCPSPELYPYYHQEGATVIVVDIFRATTTMTTAFLNGAKGILPVASTDLAQQIGQERGFLIAAERNVKRCAFADLGNDPMEYSLGLVEGKEIVMTTTNGTKAINIAYETGAKEILIGSFLNLKSIVSHCLKQNPKDIIVLGAGWQGQMSTEDSLYAGALSYELEQAKLSVQKNDGTQLMQDLWEAHCLDFTARTTYLAKSEHYARLKANGFAEAADYCLTIQDDIISLPMLSKEADGNLWLRLRD